MSFETVSLLMSWLELGTLLAILFRLAHIFELIANTQRELRRAIHHLGERRAAEPGINNAFAESGIALAPGSRRPGDDAERTIRRDDQNRLPQPVNP